MSLCPHLIVHTPIYCKHFFRSMTKSVRRPGLILSPRHA